MGLLWGRSAVITMGPKELAGPNITFNRIKFTGLRISFTIEKTLENNVNTGTINIVNLGQANWSFIQASPKPYIILGVGYGTEKDNEGYPIVDEIFVGDIKKMQYIHQGPDTITTFEAGDGSLALENAKIDKSYKEGFSLKLAAQDTLQSIKNAGGVVIKTAIDYLKSSNVPDTKAQAGLCLSGMADGILSKLTGALSLEWSIQDNEMQILPQGGCTTEEVIVLSPSTGLVGSPIKREEGVEFTALIQTKIKPGRRVQISSLDTNGDYRVKKVKFVGDTHDTPWYATVEAMPI